jgi:hypothetical protein
LPGQTRQHARGFSLATATSLAASAARAASTRVMQQPGPNDECDRFIGSEGTEPLGAQPRTGDPKQRELEEMIDAALACTFPASDPIGCFSRPSDDQ